MSKPYLIKVPIWSGEKVCVGIAESRLAKGKLEIEIGYENKMGKRTYPHLYSITKEKALTYTKQDMRGLILRIIPISDLFIEKERNL